MADIILRTDLDPKATMKVVTNAAEELGFAVYKVEDGELRLQQGSLIASIFVGAFIAYCDFRVFIDEGRRGSKLVIQRNVPWWTGFIGVGRVKKLAQRLADLVEEDLGKQEGRALGRDRD